MHYREGTGVDHYSRFAVIIIYVLPSPILYTHKDEGISAYEELRLHWWPEYNM